MDIKGIVKRLKKNHNTCAHELGHSILHPNVNPPFLRKHTLFSIDKIERQANAFAVELLLPDEFLDECSDINFATVAKSNGIPEGLEVLKNQVR